MNDRELRIINLFPSTVGEFKLGRDFTQPELDYINGLELRANELNKSSKYSYVLEEEVLSDLKKFCYDSVNRYFNEIYKPKEDVRLSITQSWTNNAKLNQGHHKHNHPNSVLSGVFYIAAQEEDNIVFYNPVQFPYHLDRDSYDMFNTDNWVVPSVTGSLLLFSSKLEHSVPRKKRVGTRISLSFNTFWDGSIGNENSKTRLSVKVV